MIPLPYKILIFDADHTLFDFDQSEKIAFHEFLKEIGLEKDADQLFPIYMKENNDTWKDLEKGLITQKELKPERFRRFIQKAKIKGDPDDFSSRYTKHLAHSSILFDDAYDIIESLSKNYRIVIVTNGLKDVQNIRIRQSKLAPMIETTVISDEIGILKPDPKIIDYTLKQVNHTNKAELVIIGDSLTSDIQCGFNAGIDTVWYNPNNKKNTLDQEPTHTIRSLKELLKIF